MNSDRRRVGTCGLVLVAATLVACGGASDGAAGPTAAAPPPAAAPAPAAPEPTPAPSAAIAPPAPSAVASAAPTPPPPPASKCPAGMAEVPGGKFKSSYYQKEMSLEPFCIDKVLATTDEYKTCVDGGKCDTTATQACDPHTWGTADRGKWPMICIDYPQAEKYCKSHGKRLPSDLEWEWAARGGEEARVFPWGSDPPDESHCSSIKTKRTGPCLVGTDPKPGPFGIQDLAGSVLQYTTTTNDTVGSFRVGRGGSWKDLVPEQVKVAHRNGFKASYRCGFLGIRCAQAIP
jgi:sulfatase modifying factor 1